MRKNCKYRARNLLYTSIDAGRIVALDTPAGLKASVGRSSNGSGPTTMEQVFIALTGRSLSDEDFMTDNDYLESAA